MTFGYSRAEVIAALINLVTLIIVGLYLVYEAIARVFAPEPIAGWIVVIVAGIALAIDIATAMLTYAMSKESINVKRSEEHTSELQSLMRISYAVFCLKKKINTDLYKYVIPINIL